MRVVVVPPVPALLPAYAGREDPVADLRAAAGSAVAWLVDGCDAVRVVAPDDQAARVAAHLLDGATVTDGPADGLLVMANGTAKRTEKAPGHLDGRALAFDDALGEALTGGDAAALAHLDDGLAAELWATGTAGLRDLAGLRVDDVAVDYADDPYGVAYWVVRWTCAS